MAAAAAIGAGSRTCRIAVAQMRSTDAVEENFAAVRRLVQQASKAQCSLISLPECFECESTRATSCCLPRLPTRALLTVHGPPSRSRPFHHQRHSVSMCQQPPYTPNLPCCCAGMGSGPDASLAFAQPISGPLFTRLVAQILPTSRFFESERHLQFVPILDRTTEHTCGVYVAGSPPPWAS